MAGYQISLVRDDLRRRGVGRELMAYAETRVVERGCHSALLDTFSFQARAFYEKLGYEGIWCA
jgi:GNAT superfamily N-acetyltransferase